MTLVPYIKGSGEHKSKPTQHSVKELRSIGISPDNVLVEAVELPQNDFFSASSSIPSSRVGPTGHIRSF